MGPILFPDKLVLPHGPTVTRSPKAISVDNSGEANEDDEADPRLEEACIVVIPKAGTSEVSEWFSATLQNFDKDKKPLGDSPPDVTPFPPVYVKAGNTYRLYKMPDVDKQDDKPAEASSDVVPEPAKKEKKKKRDKEKAHKRPEQPSSALHGADFDAVCRLAAAGDTSEALQRVLEAMPATGLEATNVGRARDALHRALQAKKRSPSSVVVLVSYTSNLISCGLREFLSGLAKSKLVDAFVSTAGGVEEDAIKCLGKTVIGDFALKGADLRPRGMNRVGNLLIPNDNYVAFEEFFVPILEATHRRQRESRWDEMAAPSDLIDAMGKSLADVPGHERSLVYWCTANGIPLFCPALTDGSMGDMIYFYNVRNPGMVVDPLADVVKLRRVISEGCSSGAKEVVVVSLGAGLPRHHTMKHVVESVPAGIPITPLVVATGNPADGCSSSCVLDDDIAEGLVRPSDADRVVHVHGDATVIFPLMLAGFPSE